MLFPCSHVLFVHWGGGRISCFTNSSHIASLLHHLLLSSLCVQLLKTTCTVQTALHLSGAATNNRKRGINQISRVRHRICFSLVISCPILCPRPLLSPSCSTDVKRPPPDVYHDPHYISVVISQTQKIHCIMWSFFLTPLPPPFFYKHFYYDVMK